MPHQNTAIGPLLDGSAILPVITIHNLADAIPLALTLCRGGLNAIEITLRTPVALDSIRLIRETIPGMIVGAGTVNNTEQFEAAYQQGAAFIVSPGFTSALLDAADTIPLPYLPGVATVSECMQLKDQGYHYLKLFPAEAIGGCKFVQTLAAPLPDIRFCPTGGITQELAADYLALSNVFCLGSSWLTPHQWIHESAWDQIEQSAYRASQLKKSCPPCI